MNTASSRLDIAPYVYLPSHSITASFVDYDSPSPLDVAQEVLGYDLRAHNEQPSPVKRLVVGAFATEAYNANDVVLCYFLRCGQSRIGNRSRIDNARRLVHDLCGIETDLAQTRSSLASIVFERNSTTGIWQQVSR